MIGKPALLIWILPVLAACQPPQPEQGAGTSGSPLQTPALPDVNTVSYRCESGAVIEVTMDAARTVHLDHEGQTQTLQSEGVATGTAYKNARYRWVVTHGNQQERAELYKDGTRVEVCSRHRESAAPEPGLAPCRSDQIDLGIGETDAGMGHRQQTFVVTLKGEQPCLLPAWPVIKLEGEEGKAPPKVARTTDSYFGTADLQERQRLTVEHAVMFHIGWSIIPDETSGDGVCPKVTSLEVAAPGGGMLKPVIQDFEACGRGVVLSPFRPSTSAARKSD